MTARLNHLFPRTEKVGSISVPVNRLEAFLSPAEILDPALLKIDVQGGELDVLRGCETLLDRFRHIYVELSFAELYAGQPLCHEVIQYLEEWEFHLTGVNNVVYDRMGMPIQADFLFTRVLDGTTMDGTKPLRSQSEAHELRESPSASELPTRSSM
jgi:hypothetical protein